jgi:hypothetical protein
LALLSIQGTIGLRKFFICLRLERIYNMMGQFLEIEKYDFNQPNTISFTRVDWVNPGSKNCRLTMRAPPSTGSGRVGGSLRVFRQFAWLEVGSGKVALSYLTPSR